MKTKIKNIVSFIIMMLFIYAFYTYNSEFFGMFNVFIKLNFFGYYTIKYNFLNLFKWATLIYSISYIIYSLIFVNVYAKPYYFIMWIKKIFKYLFTLKGPDFSWEEKHALLNILVKFIFLPVMFFWWNLNLQSMLDAIALFNTYKYTNFLEYYYYNLHWLIFRVMLFFDILIFVIGYAFEGKFLKNEIKSVNPYFFGWFAALSCYPLYSSVTLKILWWYSTEAPNFMTYFWNNNFTLLLSCIFAFMYLILMAVYVWASFSLWFKASNLTNRWIVSIWAYSVVRHPAYAFKNMARLVGSVPFIFYTIKVGNWSILGLIIFSLWGWLIIYHLRAITEEQHLSLDPDYLDYKQKVRYRYIPGVM